MGIFTRFKFYVYSPQNLLVAKITDITYAVITKRDFIFHVSYFYEKFTYIYTSRFMMLEMQYRSLSMLR